MNDVLMESKRLLQRKQFFYYNILKQFRFIRDDAMGTLGVCWVKDKMYLRYSGLFADRYSPEEMVAILEHEVSHFVFDHVEHFEDTPKSQNTFKDEEEAADYVRSKELKQLNHKLNNIAMDRSINIHLPYLPNIRLTRKEVTGGEGDDKKVKEMLENARFYSKGLTEEEDIFEVDAITEDSFKKLLEKSNYPGDLDAVEKFGSWKYYKELLNQCPDIQEQADKIKQMDVHFKGEGEEGKDGEPSNGYKNRVIIEAMRNSNHGDIPGHLRSQLDLLAKQYDKEPLPWNKILKRVLNKARESVIRKNINVRNTQYTGTRAILTGHINHPILEIAIVNDVSGSCASEDIQSMFWNEIMGISKNAAITIYHTDVDVEQIQKFKGKKKVSEEDYKGTGGGGTDLDKGILRAIEDKSNVIIMLTDNWMEFRLTKEDMKGTRIICVSNTTEKMPEHYGQTIHIGGNND